MIVYSKLIDLLGVLVCVTIFALINKDNIKVDVALKIYEDQKKKRIFD